jgi:hypothetical protein
MQPLINYTIPKRNYERVRDAIGFILDLELTNQYANHYNPEMFVDGIFCERQNPIDKTEMAYVNVSVIASKWDRKHVGSKEGEVQFAVDIYTKYKSEANVAGDAFSQKKMQSLAAACDYILEDPQYKTLGFAPGFIRGFIVSELMIKQQNPEDATNAAMGRLIVTVNMSETNQLLPGTLILGNTTNLQLWPTMHGYQYITN